MAVVSLADVEALERTPWPERGLAVSTFETLRRSAERHGDKIALRFLPTGSADASVRDMTYAQLQSRIVQAANLFHKLGVTPDSAVSMLLPLAPESFVAMFGAHTAGMANPINFLLEPAHIAALIQEANGKILLAPDPELFPGLWPKIEAVLALCAKRPTVLRVGGPPERADIAALHFETELDREPSDHLTFDRRIAPRDVAALFHTGGTTAAPKLARQTHEGLAMHAWVMTKMLDTRAEDVCVNGLPIFHVGGAYCAGLTPLSLGMTVVILTPAGLRNPDVVRNLWRIVERFGVSFLGMVPTSWGAAMNVASEGCDIASIRLCNSGGAALPAEIARMVQRRLGVGVAEGWGMTELHGFAALNPAAGDCRVGSVGLRTPYNELIVAALEGERVERRLPAGEIGRVLARGPQLFAGYVNPAHDAGAWIEPELGDSGGKWFDSGDLGRFDDDGYLWLTGRAKDLIIRGGHNIDPAPVEETLYAHPAVEAAAVVGRPDLYAGELPVAFVQLKPGASAAPAELLAFARERTLERAAAPVDVQILPRMPLTGVGKIFKPELRQIATRQAIEMSLAAMPDPPAGVVVEVAAHPKFGWLAAVRVADFLSPERAEAIRALLGRFQIKAELAE